MREIVIDTNVILRLLLGDIPQQTQKSKKLFQAIEKGRKKGMISVLVINELVWILEHFYQQKRKDYLPPILKLLSLRKIKILEGKKGLLIRVLGKMRESSLDFVDLYLVSLAKEKGLSLKSFDKKLIRFFA